MRILPITELVYLHRDVGINVDDLKSFEEDPDTLTDNEQENDGEENDVASFPFSFHSLDLRIH